MKDKKNFSDLGSTDTAVRFADVDEDTRLLKSEGAVPLQIDDDEDTRLLKSEGAVPFQRDDDDDDDGFVSPLKATVNFEEDTNLRQHHPKRPVDSRRMVSKTTGLRIDGPTTASASTKLRRQRNADGNSASKGRRIAARRCHSVGRFTALFGVKSNFHGPWVSPSVGPSVGESITI